jgi:hypothetical protein
MPLPPWERGFKHGDDVLSEPAWVTEKGDKSRFPHTRGGESPALDPAVRWLGFSQHEGVNRSRHCRTIPTTSSAFLL